MKKLGLAVLFLIIAATAAEASPIQVILSTAASSTRVNGVRIAAPTRLYGIELTLQLPPGVAVKRDTAVVSGNLVDPSEIVLLDNAALNTGTIVAAAVTPAALSTEGDTLTLNLLNVSGFKFGIYGSLWFDFKPGFIETFDTTTLNVGNLPFQVVSFRAFDAAGNYYPATQVSGSIYKTLVWK